MRVLTAGGGSGGHVTPVVAVLKELRDQYPDLETRFWCDVAFATQATQTIHAFDPSIRVQKVIAGKLRRYHHLTFFQHLTMPSTVLLNIRDMFLIGIGLVQSLARLIIWRPDVVFTKGGFVCLPIGIAAHILRIPLVIHDSDAHPGLTNRLLARFAATIATGAPLKYYSYPKDRSHYVGIPVAKEFRQYSVTEKKQLRDTIGVKDSKPLVVITGGGLGATRINNATMEVLETLEASAIVILLSGQRQYDELRTMRPNDSDTFRLIPFVSKNMYAYLGAADVVVARAGATTLLELAALGSAVILIPNGKLTGGHQLKNAQVYIDAGAAIIVDDNTLETNPESFASAIVELLHDTTKRHALSRAIMTLATPNASSDMSQLVTKAAAGQKK